MAAMAELGLDRRTYFGLSGRCSRASAHYEPLSCTESRYLSRGWASALTAVWPGKPGFSFVAGWRSAPYNAPTCTAI
jgi:hypothetical protein